MDKKGNEMNNNTQKSAITVNQKAGIVVAVIVFTIMLVMYGAVIVETLYLITGNLTVTKVSAGCVGILIVLCAYFFKKNTDSSYEEMNKSLNTSK